jgi:hypothetical protein
MDYDIKKGHFGNVEGDGLKNIVNDIFGNAKMEGDLIVSTFGALERLETKVAGKTTLFVCTKMRTDVSPEVGADTVKRYNQFLERATGLTSKERGKRLQKKAKEGKL